MDDCFISIKSRLPIGFIYLSRQEFYGNLATKITWLATMMGFIGLLVRWYESYLIGIDVGHIPVSNLYEVFVLFCLDYVLTLSSL